MSAQQILDLFTALRGRRASASETDHPLATVLKLSGSELLHHPLLAAALTQVGSRLSNIRLNDVRRAASRHPALFVIGGLALGAVCGRVAKTLSRDDAIDGEVEPRVPTGHLRSTPSSRRTRTFGG